MITAFLFSLFLIYDTIVPAKHYTRQQFGVFKETAEDVVQWLNTYGRKNVSVAVNVINKDYINYYFSRMINPVPDIAASKIETPADFNSFFKTVHSAGTEYFAYIWTNAAHPFEVPGIIRTAYPYLVEKKNYFNASSYLFAKQPHDTMVNTDLFSSKNNYENEIWPMDHSKLSIEKFNSPVHSEKMDNEFSASLRVKSSDIREAGYRYVTFKSSVYPADSINNAKIVISFDDRNGKPFSYHSRAIKDFNIEQRQWQNIILAVQVPADFTSDKTLVAYIWNPAKENFYIDDLEVQVHKDEDPYQQFFNWKRSLFY